MAEKPIQFKCPCCSAVVLIHPSHPRYHEYRFELMRESHPEVADEEPLEGCEQLRMKLISPEGAESEEEL